MSRKARRAAAQSESQLTIDERCNARRKAEAEAGDEFERRWKSREKEWADLKAAVEKCDTWTDGAEVACVSEVVKVARRLGLEAELGTAQERRSRLDRQDDQELAAGIFGDIIAGELKLAAKRVANQDDRSGIRHHFRFICKSVLQSLADRHAELASENPPRGFDVWSRAPYYDACRDNLIERWEKHEQRKAELAALNSTSQLCEAPIPQAPGESWIECIDDSTYRVGNSRDYRVTTSENELLQQFIDAPGNCLTTGEIEDKTSLESGSVAPLVAKLIKKYGSVFEPAIIRPMVKGGGGYVIRVRMLRKPTDT